MSTPATCTKLHKPLYRLNPWMSLFLLYAFHQCNEVCCAAYLRSCVDVCIMTRDSYDLSWRLTRGCNTQPCFLQIPNKQSRPFFFVLKGTFRSRKVWMALLPLRDKCVLRNMLSVLVGHVSWYQNPIRWKLMHLDCARLHHDWDKRRSHLNWIFVYMLKRTRLNLLARTLARILSTLEIRLVGLKSLTFFYFPFLNNLGFPDLSD